MITHPYEIKLPQNLTEAMFIERPIPYSAYDRVFRYHIRLGLIPNQDIIDWLNEHTPSYLLAPKQWEAFIMFEHESELIRFKLSLEQFND